MFLAELYIAGYCVILSYQPIFCFVNVNVLEFDA